MWLFLTRRLRMWLILSVAVPLASGLFRRLGLAVQRRNGPRAVSDGLLQAGSLAERVQAKFGATPAKKRRFARR